MRRISGKYWQYLGNHFAGENQSRRTPKGYTVEDYTVEDVIMIQAIIEEAEGLSMNDYKLVEKSGVSKAELKNMHIIYHKEDGFGREITVTAPKSVWEKVKAMRDAAFADFLENFGEKTVEIEDFSPNLDN